MKLMSICLVSSVALVACSDKDEKKETPSLASQVAGSWRSENCENLGANGFGTRNFVFTESTWSIEFKFFADAACQTHLNSFGASGSWNLKEAADVAGATKAFFGFSSRAMTPKSDGGAAFLNSNSVCGKSDWAVGTSFEFNTPGCALLGAKPVAECSGEYDLVKLDGGKLYLGDRSEDMCDQTYPTRLYGVALVKQ